MTEILILHGWGSCAENWKQVKKLLEIQGYKVFVPDFPGFGENPPLTKPWSLDNYAEWVKEFCEKQNLSQIFLLGHSFGGRIAVKFVVKYPEKVKGLILVSAAGIKQKKNLKQISLFRIAKIGSKFSFCPCYSLLRRIFYKLIVKKTDYLKVNGALKETFKKIIGEDLRPYLSKIKTSTLIIWGQKDKITPLSDAYLIKKEIVNSEIKIIPQAGHRINLEVPEKLANIILNFLKE